MNTRTISLNELGKPKAAPRAAKTGAAPRRRKPTKSDEWTDRVMTKIEALRRALAE